MALTIEIQRSEGGIGDSAFTTVATISDDSPWSWEDTTVAPGHLYLYRARRHDSDTGLYSDWSAITSASIARAPYPYCPENRAMIDTCDVLTGADEALFFGLEPFEGVPVQAEWKLGLVDGSMTRTHGRRYSNTKRNKQTMRRKVVGGQATYEGTFTLEITPEGFWVLMLAAMAVSSASEDTHYRHTFTNAKSCRSVTLIHQNGDLYKVYVGCKVTSLTIEPDLTGDSVLVASAGFVAKAEEIYPLAKFGSVVSTFGLDTAAEDTLDSYAPEDATVYLGGVEGEVRTCSFSFDRPLTRYKVYDGTRGVKGHFSKMANTSAQLTAFFGGDVSLQRLWEDFGQETEPSSAYGLGRKVITSAVSTVFDPPNNGDGFSNRFEVLYPAADVATSEASSGQDEIVQTLAVSPIDEEGNSLGSDVGYIVDNSISGANLIDPAPVIAPANVKLTQATRFIYALAQGTPTTTSHIAGNSATNPHISRVDDAYNGRKLRYVTGTLAGQERAITDYVGSTGAFTTAAFGGAPAAGDAFVIL